MVYHFLIARLIDISTPVILILFFRFTAMAFLATDAERPLLDQARGPSWVSSSTSSAEVSSTLSAPRAV